MGQVACQTCSNIVSDTARFCPRCGGAVAWTPPSAVDQPGSQQPYQQQPYQQQPYQQDPYQQQPYQQQPYQQQPYQQQPYQQDPYQQPYQQQAYPPPYQQQLYMNPAAAPAMAYPVERKDRTVALLLAIFLGGWTWVYTYKKDAWKFWLTLALNLTLFNPLWSWLLLFLPNFALHIWAIVDVAVKPQQYYDYYPNG
jgi:hypothetical protein